MQKPLLTREDFVYEPGQGFVQLPKKELAYKAPGSNKIIHYSNAARKAHFEANADAIAHAAERGSAMHESIQSDLVKALPDYVAETIANEVFCYADFGNQMRKMPVLGFCDSIARLRDGRIAVLEFKTKQGKRYNPMTLAGYKMQLSVYFSMLKSFYPLLKLDSATLVLFFVDGSEPELFELDLSAIAKNMQGFKALARAYFSQNRWEGAHAYKPGNV